MDQTEVAVAVAGSTAWTTLWSRDSRQVSAATWTTTDAISLAAYAGQAIRLRFRFDSVDEIANRYTGWLIDDVVVTGDSGCTAGPEAIFSDGFETGGLGRWSAAVP